VSGRASNAYNSQAHCCVAVLWYMSEFGPGQVRASGEQQECRASVKASEEQAWNKGAVRVTRRVDLGCASSQTRNPALKSKMILSRARLAQTFLYVGSLACMYASPPPNNQKLCDGANTPPHRQCVHANHRPHASGDQAAYSAWPSNHAVQQDMHSANGQDADYRGRWLTAQSLQWYTIARSPLCLEDDAQRYGPGTGLFYRQHF